MSNIYAVLTHKLIFLVLLIILITIFLFTRYRLASFEVSEKNLHPVLRKVYEDSKVVFSTAGVSFVTWLVTKVFDK